MLRYEFIRFGYMIRLNGKNINEQNITISMGYNYNLKLVEYDEKHDQNIEFIKNFDYR